MRTMETIACKKKIAPVGETAFHDFHESSGNLTSCVVNMICGRPLASMFFLQAEAVTRHIFPTPALPDNLATLSLPQNKADSTFRWAGGKNQRAERGTNRCPVS